MPAVRFAPGSQGTDSFVSESAGFFTITLVLSQPSAIPVTVVVRPFASGVDSADMDLRDYTLTFAPGETTAILRAQIFDDTADETDENLFFEIVSATDATIDRSATDAYRILARILDDDAPSGPTVRFMSGAQGSESFASEGAGNFLITLTLSQPSTVPVSVVVRPMPSAVDGSDMDLADYTVTFAPGETSATYRAAINDDAIDEIDENVFFELVSVTNATIDLSSTDAYRILGRILDNDVPPGPLVRFMPGAQGSQSFVREDAGGFAISLVLSQASTVPVTVVVRPFPGAVDGVDMDMRDYSVTFAPGETIATYRASIQDDTSDEIDENVFFDLVSVTNATIDLSSTDAYHLLGRILDDDEPPLTGTQFADRLFGTANNDQITGLDGDDIIFGNDGMDIIEGGRGNDQITGGGGTDMAIFNGPRSNFHVAKSDGWIVVTDRLVAGEGRDMVMGVELFRFTDGTVSLQDLLASTTHEHNDLPAAFAGVGRLMASRIFENELGVYGPGPNNHHANLHEPAYAQIDYF